MTDREKLRIEAICEIANVKDIGDLSDGFHTFNGLYEQRMILFAALVKVYKDKAWKSHRHEDGELCFGGGWFIVGIDTPKGSYTYHYEDKFWNMFDCVELERSKHWDGHTEADAETRLMSLEPDNDWVPVTKKAHPDEEGEYLVTDKGGGLATLNIDDFIFCDDGTPCWLYSQNVVAWKLPPKPYVERE